MNVKSLVQKYDGQLLKSCFFLFYLFTLATLHSLMT